MQRTLRHLAAAFFLLILLWPVSCSKQSCTPECYKSLQWTKDSLAHFGAHLANGPTDPLVVELQRHLATSEPYQEICLIYLIGSVAIFGSVDEHGLGAMRDLCNGKTISCLSRLLEELGSRNDADTAAEAVAEFIWLGVVVKPFKRMIKENWDAMEELVMKTLRILKNNVVQSHSYNSVLRRLPVVRQYKMITTGEISLDMVRHVYPRGEADSLLRIIFLLARCSCNPNPEIRRCIADRLPFFRESLVDDRVASNIKDPCPDNVPLLADDALCRVSKFMDVETLMFVMPLVCRAWRNRYREVMMQDARSRDLYMMDLSYKRLNAIHTVLPWMWCLQDGIDVLDYFGRCIEGHGLGKTRPTDKLRRNVKEYLKAVMEGRTFLPRIGDCPTQYDAFTRLFEEVCNFCGTDRPILGKPVFLTEKEYERVVYHFVYEKRLSMGLSESLAVNNMPRLFKIIKEDEDLMESLIYPNFDNYTDASAVLIECGRTKQIPDKLARLIFGQADLFKRLVEPRIVPFSEYYVSIVEFGILAKRIALYGRIGKTVPRLLTSTILYFRNRPEMIDRIARSIAREVRKQGNGRLQNLIQEFVEVPFGSLMAAQGYTAEEFEFFKGVLARCGLL